MSDYSIVMCCMWGAVAGIGFRDGVAGLLLGIVASFVTAITILK